MAQHTSILKCSVYWKSREREEKTGLGLGEGHYWTVLGESGGSWVRRVCTFTGTKKKKPALPHLAVEPSLWLIFSHGLEGLAGECSSSRTPDLKVVLLHWRKLPFLINRQLWESCMWRVKEN